LPFPYAILSFIFEGKKEVSLTGFLTATSSSSSDNISTSIETGSLVGGVLPVVATEDVNLSAEGLALDIGVCRVDDILLVESAVDLDATGALDALLPLSVAGFEKNAMRLFCFIPGVESDFFGGAMVKT
jgi:hypothetical protein